MTPARAARIRAEKIDGKKLPRKEVRKAAKAINLDYAPTIAINQDNYVI
jgi:hypothetical protein